VRPVSEYFDRLMDYAVAADWGQRPEPTRPSCLAAVHRERGVVVS
jgi:hypothetical protein